MTARALIGGLLLATAVGSVGPYLTLYLLGSNAGGAFYTSPLSHFLFFVLVGGVNVLLHALRTSWALTSSELIILFILMAVANQSHNMIHYLVPMLSGPFYYATPENDWVSQLHPYIPDWIAPYQLDGLTGFFEGTSPDGATDLWKVWVWPLLCWLPLLVAIHAATLCLMVIFRRQWAERERIIYPLVQVSLAMIDDEDEKRAAGGFFRNPIMWIGFAVPVAIGAVQGLHSYFPYFPDIQPETSLSLFGVGIHLKLSVVALGFFYLINQQVAFSLWIFYLLSVLQRALYNAVGYVDAAEPALSVWSGQPSLVHQSMGAMMALVLSGLWVARAHLRSVLRKALFASPAVDDVDEIISYRGAVALLLISVGVMAYWLHLSGMPPLGIAVFLFFVFVIFVAITRVLVEGGVAMLFTPIVAPDAALSAVGVSQYGSSGLVGLAYARVWSNDLFNFAMPHCANGLKLAERVAGRRRHLFWAILLSILLGLTGGTIVLIYMGYAYGAINMSQGHFIWFNQYVFEYANARMQAPMGPSWDGWLHTGIGAALMTGLLMAQRYWIWWPLHPIGYPVSSVLRWVAFNAFLAWLFKSLLLKYGGVRLHNAARPLFLGLVAGQFAVYGIFWVIDSFTGMTHNALMD